MKPPSKKAQLSADEEDFAAENAWAEEERERLQHDVVNMTPVYDEINGAYSM